MTLAFVVPGLDEAASEKAIAILQNRLSQEQEAALVLKHAHWNVTGPNFIAVHEMLDPEVEAVLAQADETAERIATLGGTPDGRADAIVRNRTWKSFDAEGRVGTEEYLKALIEYYDAFIADARKAIADGLDVAIVYPAEGTSVLPDGAAIVRGCAHEENARKFIDFLLSPDVQQLLGTELSRRSVRADTASDALPELTVLPYDLRRADERRQELFDAWQALCGEVEA